MSFLAIRNLVKRFGPVAALDDVSLDIREGSRTAIVGPSGSGKSTLLRIVAGFDTSDSGSIALDDQMLVEGRLALPAHKRGVGIVSQDGSLFPHLSISDNIGFGLDRRLPDRQARIRELMEVIELDPAMLERRPHQLSGGQQQRVALARALARRPKLMLLDEPFSALDAGLREQMRQAVAKILAEAGITPLLVTHDQAEALSFADQIALMRNGRLVQVGTPRSVYFHPRDREAALFMGEALILPAVLEAGVAATVLGPIPANAPDGRADILLRPEQVEIIPANGSGNKVEVVGAEFGGSSWLLRLQLVDYPGHAPFSLRTAGTQIPPLGSRCSLLVKGDAHVLEGPAQ
jgi:iron(III) transport system ATP-binding protein